ncbi:MAG: hypothetical protein ACREUN_03365 [Burkholderiales bacterium]
MNRRLVAMLPLALLAPAAVAAVEWRSTAVSIAGTVDGRPESVLFAGKAQILSRLALDPEDSRRAKILLQIDLSGITGVGSSTRTSYVVQAQEIVTRRLAPSDVIELTFAFHASNVRAVGSSRTGVATFALSFDIATGAVTGGRAKIGSPSFG